MTRKPAVVVRISPHTRSIDGLPLQTKRYELMIQVEFAKSCRSLVIDTSVVLTTVISSCARKEPKYKLFISQKSRRIQDKPAILTRQTARTIAIH